VHATGPAIIDTQMCVIYAMDYSGRGCVASIHRSAVPQFVGYFSPEGEDEVNATLRTAIMGLSPNGPRVLSGRAIDCNIEDDPSLMENYGTDRCPAPSYMVDDWVDVAIDDQNDSEVVLKAELRGTKMPDDRFRWLTVSKRTGLVNPGRGN
jgi:hypothetical protein